MEENRMLDENMMTQAAGGSGFENPDEYRYTALHTIRTKDTVRAAEQACSR